jgi:hypothetical protein
VRNPCREWSQNVHENDIAPPLPRRRRRNQRIRRSPPWLVPDSSPTADDSLPWPPNRTLPSFRRPVSLSVSDATAPPSDEQILLVTLQGVVNRTRPRIYLLLSADDTDQLWLDTTRVPYQSMTPADLSSLVAPVGAEFEVLRGDALFGMVRQTLQ